MSVDGCRRLQTSCHLARCVSVRMRLAIASVNLRADKLKDVAKTKRDRSPYLTSPVGCEVRRSAQMCRDVFNVAYVLLALSVGVFSHNVTDTHTHCPRLSPRHTLSHSVTPRSEELKCAFAQLSRCTLTPHSLSHTLTQTHTLSL